MQIFPIKTKVFLKNQNLIRFITNHIPQIPEKAVVVITSKIVALSEGRVVPYRSVVQKERLIREESEWAMKTKYVWATLKDGALVASAGIDESNADGKLILLPKDSMKAAQNIRQALIKKYKRRDLGVLITDSRVMPLRSGVLGIALGYAGFKGLRDYRGKRDIYGWKLKYTQTNIADSLATTATLVMGEGKEQYPLGLITGAPIEFCNKTTKNELKIAVEDDMYSPLFKSFPNTKNI